MTKRKTTLIQKDPHKGTASNNYRPITCLPKMWKILTAQIREAIYCSRNNRKYATREQEEQVIYHILINTISKRSKRDGKMWLLCRLTTKSVRYCPAKLDNRLSVQDNWQSQQVYRGNHGKQVSEIDSRRKKFSLSENKEKNIPGRCAVIITICDNDDATQLYI